jgi:hypothetical protein
MAVITEPALRRKSSKASDPVAAARLRRNHRREEIIGLIAFCVAMLVVFVMRNYAS